MQFSSNIPSLSQFMKISQINVDAPGADTSEVDSSMGNKDIVQNALAMAESYADFSNIKYIGLTDDAGVLGLASTEYNDAILKDSLNEILQEERMYWDEYNDSEKQQIENIRFKLEALINNKELIAFQVHPGNIINTADQYFDGIKKEIEMSGMTFEEMDLTEDGVWGDLAALILASVFAHEATHAKGGAEMEGEGGAEATEKGLLRQQIQEGSPYGYLSQFQIIQNNIK